MTTKEKQVLLALRDACVDAAARLPEDSEWRPWVARLASRVSVATKLPAVS